MNPLHLFFVVLLTPCLATAAEKTRILLDGGIEITTAPDARVKLPKDGDKAGLFEVLYGKVRVLVRKMPERDPNQVLRFRARDSVMGVRGTEFFIDVDDERALMCTLEGTVAVQVDAEKQRASSGETLVPAGQGVVIRDGQVSAPVVMDAKQMQWWAQTTGLAENEKSRANAAPLPSDWYWSGPTAVDSLNPLALYSESHPFSLGGALWLRALQSGAPAPAPASTSTLSGSYLMSVHATAVPMRTALVYAEGDFSAKSGWANTDPTGARLHQGFALLRTSEAGHSIAVGRQEWDFGDWLVIGKDPWNPVTRVFDGALVTLRPENFRVRALAASLGDRVDSKDFKDGLAGIYVDTSILPIEAYGFWLKRNGLGGLGDPVDANATLGLVGERAASSFSGTSLFASEEAAFEMGDIGVVGGGRESLASWIATASGGTKWSAGESLGGEFKLTALAASGGTSASTVHAFQQFFPDSHTFLGLVGAFPQIRNISKLSASPGLKLTTLGKPWVLRAEYALFHRVDTEDAMYPLVNDVSKRFLGQEIDVTASFEPIPQAFFLASFGQFFPGSAYASGTASQYKALLLAQLRF